MNDDLGSLDAAFLGFLWVGGGAVGAVFDLGRGFGGMVDSGAFG